MRDPNDCRDIALTRPNLHVKHRLVPGAPRDGFWVAERAGDRVLSSKACTPREPPDPLQPRPGLPQRASHRLRAGSRAGEPELREPQPREPRALPDIPGATPQRRKGALPFSLYDSPEVTPFARFDGLNASDIEGTAAGTRKAGTR